MNNLITYVMDIHNIKGVLTIVLYLLAFIMFTFVILPKATQEMRIRDARINRTSLLLFLISLDVMVILLFPIIIRICRIIGCINVPLPPDVALISAFLIFLHTLLWLILYSRKRWYL